VGKCQTIVVMHREKVPNPITHPPSFCVSPIERMAK